MVYWVTQAIYGHAVLFAGGIPRDDFPHNTPLMCRT